MAGALTGVRSPRSKGAGILGYFAPLTLLVYLVLPHNYLLDIASAYMLKNQLHASAAQVSSFRLFTAVPLYVSFVFGFARDLWNPLGLRDRGYFLVFSVITAAIFVALAVAPLGYGSLFAGILLTMISFRFITAAYQALMALVGQEELFSGRLTAVWQTGVSVASLGAGILSGYVAEHFSYGQTFLLMASLSLLIGLFGVWRPRAIFDGAYDRPQARGAGFAGDIKRLLRHRAVYPPIVIMLLFQFAPGFNTPMQYYLANTLHAPDSIYGEFNGIFSAAFIPAYFLYAYLCRKFSLEKLLWAGAVITVPQMIPLAFIHSGTEALILAVPMGLMGGIAVGAFYDLTMRSCPPGLQGSLMMLVDGAFLLSTRASDVVGSAIYDSSPEHGFLYCVLATTAVYAAILPVLRFVPKEVIVTADGEPNPQLEAKILAEIAPSPKAG